MSTTGKTLFLASITLTYASFAFSESYEMKIVDYPEEEAVSLGIGWDFHKNKSLPNTCVKNIVVYNVPKNTKEESFETGSDTFSLSTKLNISYKTQLEDKILGSKNSKKAKFAASFDMSENSRYVLARHQIITSWDAVKSDAGFIELTDEAKELLHKAQTENKPEIFTQVCGHGYVARIENGAEFYARFDLNDDSYSGAVDLKFGLESSLDNSVTDTGTKGSIRAQVKTKVEKNKINIEVLEEGGTAGPAATNFDSVLDAYSTFPKRAVDAPTQVKLAVFPYPKQNHLLNADTPYEILAREYNKWLYLSTITGKLISLENDPGSGGFVKNNKINANKKELEAIQEMAQAKLDVIKDVTKACIKYIKGLSKNKDKEKNQFIKMTQKCSLYDYKSPDSLDGAVPLTVKYKGKKVNILESDVYYLVRLPLASHVFDAFEIGGMADKPIDYKKLIFDQVNGIYEERCGGERITHYCESESKVQKAVDKYVQQAEGLMYFKLRAFQGNSYLCFGFAQNDASNQPNAVLKPCNEAPYFALDPQISQVRVKYDLTKTKVAGCVRAHSFSNNGKAMILFLTQCQSDTKSARKIFMSNWWLNHYRDIIVADVIVKDKDISARFGDFCVDVSQAKDQYDQLIWLWRCHAESDQMLNQKWRLTTPTFSLDKIIN